MAPNSIETVRLLLVSSDVPVLRLLSSAVQSNSWHLETSNNGWDAMERVQSESAPDLLLLDLSRGDDSLHLLPWLRRLRPELPIVVLCDQFDTDKQKEATRMGAKDALLRPVTEDQIESVVRKYLASSKDCVEPEIASEDIESVGEDEFFLSISPIMQQLRAQTKLLAQTDVPVLILGEPGSGKGTIARLIHQMSVYSGFNFLRVNCAEMPGDLLEIELFGKENRSEESSKGLGKLRSGQKGTLLLDEISHMPLTLQSKLLKVLHDRRSFRLGNSKTVDVDVRILASSSDQLDRALAEKRLDTELYYRLSAFTVHVPPLRQRKEEINFLLRYTMRKVAKHYGLSAREFTRSAVDACQNHSWPGNLKELENFVKRYLVAGDENLSLDGWESTARASGNRVRSELDLSKSSSTTSTLKSMIQNVRWETERNAIAAALQKTGWNRKAAARLLGVSYRTILYKIEQYEMIAPESYLSFSEPRLALPSSAKGNGKAT